MYAKIFRQIYDSSIVEDLQVRVTFMDLIILADSDGVVDMTHEAISRRTNVPIEWVKKAIQELESPDPKSRTNDHHGARIIRLDEHREWGWYIVNYNKFRELASDDQRRIKTRERVQRFREKHSDQEEDVTLCNALKRECNDSTYPSSSPSSSPSPLKGTEDREVQERKEKKPELPKEAAFWNSETSFPKVISVSEPRLTKLRARRRDQFWVENFYKAVIRIKTSNFCNGKNVTGWKASFDWILQPDVVLKIMEGKYDNRELPKQKENRGF